MKPFVYHEYLPVDGAELFTVVCLPEAEGTFPIVIYRSPYVDQMEEMSEQEICEHYTEMQQAWLMDGYAVVYQHCRGRGRSSGDCIPYIYEREDGLALQAWVRGQPFYQGEIYLCGGSYLTSVHYATAPFAPDIKGAVLEVQDCERYNVIYRNGFFKIGLHGNWYVGMYKKKSLPVKHYVRDSFRMLPLCDFSRTVFGERSEDFDECLRHPDRGDPFWNTRFGGADARDAVKHAGIPILFVTGMYDIYTGGIFDMWNALDEYTRSLSALAVHPYDHSGKPDAQPLAFENGMLREAFGNYPLRWLNAVRSGEDFPFEQGKITYYEQFGSGWQTDAFAPAEENISFVLGEGERTYRYNPYAPASFPGGLSANFGGTAWQDPPQSRPDILTFYTPVFEKETCIKGKMTAKLCVRSNCEDTCFYMRISLVKSEGDYGLRDDINQISGCCAHYTPGDEVMMEFAFDEHAFVIQPGEKLRIDVSSSAFPHYVPHTNNRGLFSEQTTARIADNTVICCRSCLTLPLK